MKMWNNSYDMAVDIKTRQLVLERVTLGANFKIPIDNLERIDVEDHAINCIVSSFRLHLLGQERTTEYEVKFDYPATTWDMFKQDYAPKWFLAKYPVKYDTTKKKVEFKEKALLPEEFTDGYDKKILIFMEACEV